MTQIITAVIIVTVIGIACGVLLALASKFMSVKVDTKEAELRACLPGANCGACGYTGCDGYAKALREDSSIPTNLCIPGAEAVSEKIAAVLGVEAQSAEKFAAYVRCHGDCDSTVRKYNYEGIKSCAAEAMHYGSDGVCAFSCIGLGDCRNVCTENAICIEKGIARIDPRRCIGCGMCSKTCPKKIIAMIPVTHNYVVGCSNRDKGAVARRNCTHACIGCMKCQKNCPTGAIMVVNNLATIDMTKCSNCGLCSEICPVKCIKTV